MAYSLDEENLNKQGQQADTDNAPSPQAPPTTSSAPGAGPGAATGKAQTPQSAPAQPFQNLNAYLTANAPQVQQQATNVANDLNTQYGQIQSDINQGKTDFGNQVQGGYVKPNEDLVNQAATNTAQFAQDPNNVKAFQDLYNDQYTGPQNFESTGAYGDLTGKVNKAKQNADLFGSNSGIQTYFQGHNQNATKGGNILDSVLFQGNAPAYKQVTDAASQFGNLNDYLSGAVTEANQGVSDAQRIANETAQGVKNRFTGEGGIIPSFQNTINQNVTNANTEADKRYQDALNTLKSGNFSNVDPQIASDLGIDTRLMNSGESILNFLSGHNMTGFQKDGYTAPMYDFEKYAEKFTPQLNAANVSSTDDYEKAAALSQLTGESPLLSRQDASMAGTGNRDIVGYDKFDPLDYLKYYTGLQRNGYGVPPPPTPPAPPPPPIFVDPNTGQPIVPPSTPHFGDRPSAEAPVIPPTESIPERKPMRTS